MRLLEIIIGLAILSTLSLASFSSYVSWHQQKELREYANALINALHFTKELSILKGKTIYLCQSQDQQSCSSNWAGDIVIFETDNPPKIETILKSLPPISPTCHLTINGLKSNSYIYFMENGEVANNSSLIFNNGNKTLSFTLSKTGIVSEAP